MENVQSTIQQDIQHSGLNAIANRVYLANVEKGFYEENANLLEFVSENGSPEMLDTVKHLITAQRLALITSETSETLEADRHNKKYHEPVEDFKYELSKMDNSEFEVNFRNHVKDTKEDEVADQFIRLLDYAGANGIDLEFHVAAKLRYNILRPHKHGKQY